MKPKVVTPEVKRNTRTFQIFGHLISGRFQGGPEASAQGRKRNPNLNFEVRIPLGRVGVFHVKGWWSKSPVCPLKPRETKLFGGISRDFCRDVPGVTEKFEKKSLCSIFVP